MVRWAFNFIRYSDENYTYEDIAKQYEKSKDGSIVDRRTLLALKVIMELQGVDNTSDININIDLDDLSEKVLEKVDKTGYDLYLKRYTRSKK